MIKNAEVRMMGKKAVKAEYVRGKVLAAVAWVVVSIAVVGLLGGCGDEKVIDRGLNVWQASMINDTTIMLEVSYWEEVEFYSSYIQGKDSEVRHKDSKFILTNPMNGKIYKEISVPKEDVRYHRDQVLEKSIAYFKYNEDCNCITDLGVWPYLVENGVTFLQRESLIDDTTDYSTQGKPSFKRILSTHRSDGRLNFKERHFFVWDTEKNTFAKWIPTGKSEWMTECNDIQWTEKHFRCVLAKDGILLLDENQMVLDSIAKGDYHLEESAKYSLRFYGNYIGVGHEIYKMEDNGKISDNPLFEIHLKQGAFIYTSTGDTISYTEENL